MGLKSVFLILAATTLTADARMVRRGMEDENSSMMKMHGHHRHAHAPAPAPAHYHHRRPGTDHEEAGEMTEPGGEEVSEPGSGR